MCCLLYVWCTLLDYTARHCVLWMVYNIARLFLKFLCSSHRINLSSSHQLILQTPSEAVVKTVESLRAELAPPSISHDTSTSASSSSSSSSTSFSTSQTVECYRLSDGVRIGRFQSPQNAIRFIEGRAGARIMGWR